MGCPGGGGVATLARALGVVAVVAVAGMSARAETGVRGGEEGSSVWSVLPNEDCRAKLKVCYQGWARERLVWVQQQDKLNPCYGYMELVNYPCAAWGYVKEIGRDPVLWDLTLWRKPWSESERDSGVADWAHLGFDQEEDAATSTLPGPSVDVS